MILGVGSDLCNMERIGGVLSRFGDRFESRCYTHGEREKFLKCSVSRRISFLTKAFCAKEAFVKALGTGFSGGISMKDIGVDHYDTGQPFLHVSGKAAERLGQMVPADMKVQIDLSLTDEPPLAHAIVIISVVGF